MNISCPMRVRCHCTLIQQNVEGGSNSHCGTGDVGDIEERQIRRRAAWLPVTGQPHVTRREVIRAATTAISTTWDCASVGVWYTAAEIKPDSSLSTWNETLSRLGRALYYTGQSLELMSFPGIGFSGCLFQWYSNLAINREEHLWAQHGARHRIDSSGGCRYNDANVSNSGQGRVYHPCLLGGDAWDWLW